MKLPFGLKRNKPRTLGAADIQDKAIGLMMEAFSDRKQGGMIARHGDDGGAIASLCVALGYAYVVMPELIEHYKTPEHYADCVRTMVLEIASGDAEETPK
jgi:hypothetical protein